MTLARPSNPMPATSARLTAVPSRRDLCGNLLTTGSDDTVAAWNATLEGVMAHAAETPNHLAKTLAADPRFALGLAARGIMLLTLARGEFTAAARASLADARASAAERPITAREQSYIDGLALWLDGRPTAAADRIESALIDAPQDALAFKFGHAIRFMAGDRPGMLSAAERHAPAFGRANPLAGYVMGCQAFAFEEAGRYGEAADLGRRAIQLAPRDAWGRHAVAHTMEMTGRSAEGAEFLGTATDSWAHCNNFGSHMFWHLALFLMELGRIDEVFALYDTAIRANRTDDFRDIANGASLLMRLELLGHSVGDRWAEMGEIAARRIADRQLVFADLHYLLALLRSGKGDQSRSLIATLVGDPATYDAHVAAMVGREAAEGLLAFEDGDNLSASRHLGAARDGILAVGGSNAQRDLFEQVYVESLVRAGRYDEAERVLSQRLAARGGRNAIAERLTQRLRRSNAAPSMPVLAASAIAAVQIPIHH